MKNFLIAIGLGILFTVTAASASAQAVTWQLDPAHSNAQFSIRHLGISNVQGEFTKVSGTVQLDDQDISKSSVTASIDADSVFTRVQKRDEDLRSERFFDVAKYPTITFQSTKIWSTGANTAKMTGNLTIRGVTKEVTFEVTGPSKPIQVMGGIRRGASAATTINRQDFGITVMSNALPGIDEMLGDQVTITLDIEMVKK
ncbi:MAG: YceI family protein [Candidatus Acidiferrales bacterium]